MGNNGLILVEQTILATKSAPKVQISPAQGSREYRGVSDSFFSSNIDQVV
jgi:hypothetical protein